MQSANQSQGSGRIALFTLAFIVVAFLGYSLPPYLSIDPRQSRIPVPDNAPLYYPFLLVHIVFATVAIVTCCLQMWPWLRQQSPAIHRLTGRIYVFGGVIPAALAGMYITSYLPFGLSPGASNIMLSLLWITFTLVGFRLSLKKNFEGHHRWMIRSFALTMSILLNRIFLVPTVLLALALEIPDEMMPSSIAGVVSWLSWTMGLLLAEWYLERKYTYVKSN